MSIPTQVDIFFPDQPFGGVLVELPDTLELIGLSTGLVGPPGPQGPQGQTGAASNTTLQSGATALVSGQNYIDVAFPMAQPDANWFALCMNIVNLVDSNALVLVPGTITNKTTSGCRVFLNGAPDSGNYFLQWGIFGVPPGPPPVATSYTLTGPTSGEVGVISAPFTVALFPLGGTVASPVTVTPHDGGGGGTFTPSTVILTTGSPSATFTYTPASTGAKTISTTNDGSLTDPGTITYTSNPGSPHLLTGLVSYWKFDETGGATTLVDSHGSNNLSLPDGINSVAGKINTCADFNAASANDIARIPSNSSLKPTGDFSFSVWLRLDDVTGDKCPFWKGDAAVAADFFLSHNATNGFNFGLSAGAVQVGSPATAFVFYHVVCWYDSGSGNVSMRINDATTYTAAATRAATNDELTVGGITFSGAPNLFNKFVGLIDEMGFWNKKLSGGEITALYNGGAGLPLSSFTP